MDRTPGDVALHEHLQANPEAQHAALHDPEFAAETHRLRQVLDHLDVALAAEGLDGEARKRVGAHLAAECLGTDDSNARMRDHAQAVRSLYEQGLVHVSSL